MNPEMLMQKENSSEGQKKEMIIDEVQRYLQDGAEQFEMLPEDQKEVLESIKDEKLDEMRTKIEEKLKA